MLSHTHVGVTDFDRAFYSKIMDALGCPLKFLEPERPWAGWKPPDADRPLLVMGKPENGEPAMPGNGQMVALLAPSRAAVDHCLRCRNRGGRPIARPTGIAAAISSVVLWRLFSAIRKATRSTSAVTCQSRSARADGFNLVKRLGLTADQMPPKQEKHACRFAPNTVIAC